jgi:hypothetical protein
MLAIVSRVLGTVELFVSVILPGMHVHVVLSCYIHVYLLFWKIRDCIFPPETILNKNSIYKIPRGEC